METAQLGHNNPPATSFDLSKDEIDNLYEEATNWLDGDPIESQDIADGVSDLMKMIRDAKKTADAARKLEAKPFDDGKAEVQARYTPIIKKADTAVDVCKKALRPWLELVDQRQREEQAEARRIADEKIREAQEAARAVDANNLIDREKAEAKIKEAQKADKAATRAEKATAKSGTLGRSVSLRSTWTPVLTDSKAAARHYWTTNQTDIEDTLVNLAENDVRRGKRTIPGFEVKEERKAV